MVGKLAQLQYPDGVLVSTLDPWKAVKETRQLFEQERITKTAWFESIFFARTEHLRTDRSEVQGR
jgi:hypothetical protein